MQVKDLEDALAPVYEHLYLSPHLDDAVLSCGGAIAAHRAAGARVLVITVCAGVPAGEDEAAPAAPTPFHVSTRRQEDARAMELLDVDYFWAHELDAIYRRPEAYGPPRAPFGAMDAGDDFGQRLTSRLASIVQRHIRTQPHAVVHAPLGAGEHVDHIAVSDAARAVTPRASLALYEDLPYVAMSPQALAVGTQRLGAAVTPQLCDVTPHLETKLDAVAAYASQMEMLFGGAERMRAVLRGYARACAQGAAGGGALACEREWRLGS